MNLTSAEQSKKLIELGIDENTRDYVVFDRMTGNHQFPAWTAEKLLELMPSEDNFSDENYIDMRLCIGYCHIDYINAWDGIIHTESAETLLETAFNMMCWILKHNKELNYEK